MRITMDLNSSIIVITEWNKDDHRIPANSYEYDLPKEGEAKVREVLEMIGYKSATTSDKG